jgi:hypothetical protein
VFRGRRGDARMDHGGFQAKARLVGEAERTPARAQLTSWASRRVLRITSTNNIMPLRVLAR